MKKFSFTVAFFAFIFFCGCKKSSVEASQEATQNSFGGSVLLFDEGSKVVDPSGITISIENSNPVVSAITGKGGDFNLNLDPNLQSFALVYSKPELGTFKRYFIRSASGELYKLELNDTKYETTRTYESLGYKSTVTVNSFNVAIVNGKLRYTSNISTPNDSGYIRVIFQKDLPNISMSTVDNKSRSNWSYVWKVKNGDNAIDLCLVCSLTCTGWVKGDVIYMTAYGDSYYSNLYVDESNKSIILPNMNLNNNLAPVSVVIP